MTLTAIVATVAVVLVGIVIAILANWASQRPAPFPARVVWSLLAVVAVGAALLALYQAGAFSTESDLRGDALHSATPSPTASPSADTGSGSAEATPFPGATAPSSIEAQPPAVDDDDRDQPEDSEESDATDPTSIPENDSGTSATFDLICSVPVTMTIGAYGEGTVTIRVTGALDVTGPTGARTLTISGPAGTYYISATDVPGGGAQGVWLDSADPDDSCYSPE